MYTEALALMYPNTSGYSNDYSGVIEVSVGDTIEFGITTANNTGVSPYYPDFTIYELWISDVTSGKESIQFQVPERTFSQANTATVELPSGLSSCSLMPSSDELWFYNTEVFSGNYSATCPAGQRAPCPYWNSYSNIVSDTGALPGSAFGNTSLPNCSWDAFNYGLNFLTWTQ
jgi:hypothetical protein